MHACMVATGQNIDLSNQVIWTGRLCFTAAWAGLELQVAMVSSLSVLPFGQSVPLRRCISGSFERDSRLVS
jgi:hypothetical protein